MHTLAAARVKLCSVKIAIEMTHQAPINMYNQVSERII